MPRHTSAYSASSRIVLLTLWLFLFLFLIPTAGAAEPSVIWQIGKFDGSSWELHRGMPAQDPVFIVGKSDAARDWYAEQPGNSSGKAGFRAHPFTVQFELPQAPSGLYTLKLSLLVYSARLPSLDVSLNGHRGRFYQHPLLNYDGTEWPGHFLPHYSQGLVAFDVPTRFLQQGTNRLVLTAIDEPAERDDSRAGVFVVGNSAISYDALALERDPAKTYSAEAITAEVVPTIFYRSKGNGLVELVDVFVRYNEPPQRGQVTLALGSNQLTQELAAGTEFGEQRLRFEVPEFASPTAARATVSLNGRSRQFPVEVKPAKKWNVFVVYHQHMDIGYTDYPPKVAEVQSRALDEAIDMIRQHPDFRYTVDNYWPIEQFMAGRSDEQRNELLRLIREKKIFVPAQYAGMFTGLPNVESQLRSFYHSYKFLRENGGDFDFNIITDIPTHSWSYPSLMASAGLKYLMLGANNDLGPNLLIGRLHEKSPFWWEGPDGQRVLTWYSREYHQVASMFGLPPKVAAVHDTLPLFLQAYTRSDYKSDGVIVFGTQSENEDLYREQAELAGDWNKLYSYPKLKPSGVSEAMGYIAEQMGDSIPVIRGDGGPYWDVGAAGSPYYTALIRENAHRILAAEKFSTISSLVNPRIWPDRQALDQAWKDILRTEEHTGGGGQSGTLRGQHTRNQAVLESQRLAEHVLARGMDALADSIQVPRGTVIVFNSLNWQRSKLVELTIGGNQELVDRATNQTVPLETLSVATGGGGFEATWLGADNTRRRVRFLATDVPAVGYKCYTVRAANTSAAAPAASTGRTLENAYYRVVLDAASGAVASVFDKDLNRELVDASSPYRFNQYVLATGEQPRLNRNAVSTKIIPAPNLETHIPSGGRILSVTKTAFGTVAQMESSAPNTSRIATEVILFDGQKKIEITNRVQKERGPVSEWGYFAFPIAMDRPEFRYEVQNGVVNPAKDVLPGGAREWSVVQHWVAVDQDDVTAAVVPIDAPLVAFGDIIRWRWPKEFGTRKATIFSYAFSGGSRPTDQLSYTFRYVFSSGRKLESGALSKLGWDAMSPLEVNEIVPKGKAETAPPHAQPLDPVQTSFVQVSNPGVVLVTWKRAEDQKGTIMRFLETNGQSGTVDVTSSVLNVQKGWLCNSVEENQRPLTVSQGGFSFSLKPFEIVTVRLEGVPGVK